MAARPAFGSNWFVGAFGSLTVAPGSHFQQLPLFFTAGVSARGLIDARPKDAVGFGLATGYSGNELKPGNRYIAASSRRRIQNHETVVD